MTNVLKLKATANTRIFRDINRQLILETNKLLSESYQLVQNKEELQASIEKNLADIPVSCLYEFLVDYFLKEYTKNFNCNGNTQAKIKEKLTEELVVFNEEVVKENVSEYALTLTRFLVDNGNICSEGVLQTKILDVCSRFIHSILRSLEYTNKNLAEIVHIENIKDKYNLMERPF